MPLGLLAAVAIATAGRAIPRPAAGPLLGRLDVVGALLLGAALLLVNLGLSAGGEVGGATGSGARALGGTTNPLADYLVPLALGGLVAGALFLWWERRVRTPILPLSLFRRRRFATAIAANFLAGAALIVAMVDTPIVVALLVDEDRVSAVSALMLAPFTLLMAALSFGGGLVARRRGERATAAAGLALVALGYAALWLGLRGGDYVWMVPGLTIAGAGFGLVIAPVGAATIDAAPPADRGIAAGLALVFRLLGMTIGISTLTSLGVNRLETLVDRLTLPVRQADETTSAFLLRQNQFIEDRVIPLTLQVVRETFLIAGALALLALVPLALMVRSGREEGVE